MYQHTPLNQLSSAQVAEALRIIREEIKPVLQESIADDEQLANSFEAAIANLTPHGDCVPCIARRRARQYKSMAEKATLIRRTEND